MRINSPNVRVTLYASNGQPLASQNVSIPAFSTISLTGATVTFTNLNSATHYRNDIRCCTIPPDRPAAGDMLPAS